MSGMLPFIIAGVIIGLPFLALFGTAVGFLALTGVIEVWKAKYAPGLSAE